MPTDGYNDRWTEFAGSSGVSLRDWFAGRALTGWIAALGNIIEEYDGEDAVFAEHQAAVARTCYGYADAMLKARGRT